MEQNLFSGVMQDNFSGSGSIVEQVQQALLSVDARQKTEVPRLMEQLGRLEDHFPHFALLFHFLNDLRGFLKPKEEVSGMQLAGFVRGYQKRWEDTQQKASENFLRHVSLAGKGILLHSNSSAIQNLFRLLASQNIRPRVYQTVSSPVNEGLKQAEKLQRMGFPVTVFHEDAVSLFIHRVDMLILGADLVWEEAFLNKTGSFPLALVFGHFGKPVYVLAEKRKIISREKTEASRFQRFIEKKPGPPQEIFPYAVDGIDVYNYYFESIPLTRISRIFTEEEPKEGFGV